MSTQRDRLVDDSLGHTIREALQMYVRDQWPSERVWQRIRAGMEKEISKDTSGNSLRQRPFWIAPLLQVAAVLMLCLVQGVGLHVPSAAEPAVRLQVDMPAADVVLRNTSKPLAVIPTKLRDADLDFRLLKEHSTPAVVEAPAVDVHAPLPTANLGALEIGEAAIHRISAHKSVSVRTVLESRLRQ